MKPAFTRSTLNKGIQMNEVQVYEVQFSDQYGKYEIQPRGICGYEPVKVVRLEEYTAIQQQLTATTNSLTNAQEALKSAGIEADTVQAGVMELALMRDKMAAVARDFASTIAWADDVGALSMTELKRYDLDGQCEEAISRAKLDIIDAADAYLNAVRAEGLDMAAAEIDRWVGCGSLAREIRQKSIHIRAGNAGKDGV